MNFFDAITSCFRKYADFSGRARRSEFWFFTLFGVIVSAALSLCFGSQSVPSVFFNMGILIPSFSVSWRRMHDIGKEGVWSLIAFIPVVGFIIAIIWSVRDGQSGDNIYGPDPKLVGNKAVGEA